MNNKFGKFIAVYEMIGGVLGIPLCLYYALQSLSSSFNTNTPVFLFFTLIILLLVLALYCLSFIAGLFLWKRKRIGGKLSIIVQCFQIPYIVFPGLMYSFISGLQLGASITLSPNIFKVNFLGNIGSNFNIFLGTQINGVIIGINIISIIVIRYILKHQDLLTDSHLDESGKQLTEYNDDTNSLVNTVAPDDE